MKKTIFAALLALGTVLSAEAAHASPYYNNSFDGSSTTLYMTGRFAVYPTTTAAAGSLTPILQVDGPRTTVTVTYGLGVTSLTATGVTTSSLSVTGGASIPAVQSSMSITGAGGLGVANSLFVGSTVTVAGNAFEVGLSTFVVKGGSVAIGSANPVTSLDVYGNFQVGTGTAKSSFTATGALTLASGSPLTLSGAAGNIVSASSITTTGGFFGDGSHLSGIAGTLSGGTANWIPRWTGATSQSLSNIDDTASSTTMHMPVLFSTGITAGYSSSVLTSTANYNMPCYGFGDGCLVAISSVNAQQSGWFYDLRPGIEYTVKYRLINNTGASQVGVQYNLDTGANYGSFGYCTNSVAANPLQSAGQTSIFLADNSNQVGAGVTITGEFKFTTSQAAPTKVAVYANSSVYPNGNLEGCNSTGYYSGSANVGTMRIFSVSQTLTGTIKLFAASVVQSP